MTCLWITFGDMLLFSSTFRSQFFLKIKAAVDNRVKGIGYLQGAGCKDPSAWPREANEGA